MPVKGEDKVWCLVMFDLPVKTRQQQRSATGFRNYLLDEGFTMLQFSVYVQYYPASSRYDALVNRIKSNLPGGGDVRIFSLTDAQWAKAVRFSQKKPSRPEPTEDLFTIF